MTITDSDMAQTFVTVMGVAAAATIIAILTYLFAWVIVNRRRGA